MVREFLSPANARKRPYQIREELDSSVPIGSWVPFFLIIIFFFLYLLYLAKGIYSVSNGGSVVRLFTVQNHLQLVFFLFSSSFEM